MSTPTAGTTYYLQTYYDEYICQWNDGNCYYDGSWSDGNQGLEADATVSATPALPTPPQTATSYSNLECWGLSGYPGYSSPLNLSYRKDFWNDWTPYDGNQTGSNGSGSDSMSPGQSISGTGPCGSLVINSQLTSGTEWNALGALNVCGSFTQYTCPSTPNNLEVDMQFTIPDGTTYQALEFDPDFTTSDNKFTYTESVECDFSSGIWKYWDSSAVAWQPFSNIGINNVPSCSLATGRHHLQLYVTSVYTSTTHTYQYQEMIVDGQVLFDSPSDAVTAWDTLAQNSPCQGFQEYIGVEQQVDNHYTNSASTSCGTSSTNVCAYYDHYSLVIW